MYQYIKDKYFPNLSYGIYIGDAAGRIKDHSDCDFKLALNSDLEFKTPEEFFLNSNNSESYQLKMSFDLNPLSKINKDKNNYEGIKDILKKFNNVRHVVFLVGAPECGKSTFYFNILKDYLRINNDSMNEKQCKKRYSESLVSKDKICIDNTNGKINNRKWYIHEAKNKGYEVICFLFDFNKDFALYMNNIRKNIEGYYEYISFKDTGSFEKEIFSEHVPDVAIHTYFKYFEKPDIKEGFTLIENVPFVRNFFKDPIINKIYSSYQ